MKKYLVIAIIAFSIIISSCSETTSPEKTASVNIVGEMPVSLVSLVDRTNGSSSIQANEVDSIKVLQIKVLMTELKLFKSSEDTSAGKMMKAGPFVYSVDGSGNAVVLASGDVPAGSYDKIKLEFHRFSTSEASQYANDAVFQDFATSDRNSVIISGISYKNNVPTTFTFKSSTTVNVLFKFTPAFDLSEGSTNTFSIQFNPKLFFVKGTTILDPNNTKNQNDIENAIRTTIIATKK